MNVELREVSTWRLLSAAELRHRIATLCDAALTADEEHRLVTYLQRRRCTRLHRVHITARGTCTVSYTTAHVDE